MEVLILGVDLEIFLFRIKWSKIRVHIIHGRALYMGKYGIMQLGSNDLTDSDPLRVGSAIEDFVRLLHDTYGVKVVCVCQTIMHQGAVVFNCKAKLLTKYLQVVLDPIPYAIFWGHRGF